MDGCYFSILNIFYFKEKSMLFKCNKLGRNWHRHHCILNMHAMKSCAVLVALFSALAFSSRLSIVKSPQKVKSKTYENDSFGKMKISVFLLFLLSVHPLFATALSCRLYFFSPPALTLLSLFLSLTFSLPLSRSVHNCLSPFSTHYTKHSFCL